MSAGKKGSGTFFSVPTDNDSKLQIAREKTGWLERFNERVSESCSSILVKETRQALKSKQFLWTYFLLIACVGAWTLIGLAFSDIESEGGNAGAELLAGYFLILGFPLAIIIPFGAYRSLAKEYEDGTIHLISITTMQPYQIIVGKFGSAIFQMLVFLSVLAPCILLTYLLRGIALSQIVLGLSICAGSAICLTILGLFLGSAIRSRTLSIGISVLFVLLLGWLYFFWCVFAVEMLTDNGFFLNSTEFRIVTFGFSMFFGSLAVLLLVAAAAQISFASDNRSTNVRVAMVVQQVLFWAFLVLLMQLTWILDDLFWIMAMFAGHYWLIMGFLMVGESPKRSRRVQRTLPRSILARSLFSFLMPGPGRGFLFALTMMWSCGFVIGLLTHFQSEMVLDAHRETILNRGGFSAVRPLTNLTNLYGGIAVCCFYVSGFLSISFLLAKWRLHSTRYELPTGLGPAINLFVGCLLVAMFTIGSLILHFSLTSRRLRNDYLAIDVFNWYWTTYEFSETRGGSYMAWFGLLLLPGLLLIFTAVVVAARELLHRPIPVPERVMIDRRKPIVKLPAGESIDEILGL
jgi:ABC-type transport system involved in multi-copper enzyme maturation permease subunit